MLGIPDINPDFVKLYGKKFFKLIKEAHAYYESILQDQEDKPQNPHQQNVIDLCDDEDDEDEDGGSTDIYGLDDVEYPSVDVPGSQESQERSRFFEPNLSKDVEDFNRRSKISSCFVIFFNVYILISCSASRDASHPLNNKNLYLSGSTAEQPCQNWRSKQTRKWSVTSSNSIWWIGKGKGPIRCKEEALQETTHKRELQGERPKHNIWSWKQWERG